MWNHLVDPERLFVQALIQVSVAMHHYRQGNPAGALSLLQRASRKLDGYPECFGGIDVASLRDDARAWLLALENTAPYPRSFPAIHLVAG